MGHKIKILIVDDSYLARLEIKLALEQFNFELLELESMEVFFRTPQQYRNLDLILLDISLPGLDGVTALEMMRDESVALNVPVIMITGRADRRTVQRALQAGALDYIIKPFTRKELLERVARALQLNHAEWPGEEILLQIRLEVKRAARGSSVFTVMGLQPPERSDPAALQQLYATVKNQLREIDTLFLAGKTLIFVLPLTDAAGAGKVFAKILGHIPQEMAAGVKTAVASFPDDGRDEQLLLGRLKEELALA